MHHEALALLSPVLTTCGKFITVLDDPTGPRLTIMRTLSMLTGAQGTVERDSEVEQDGDEGPLQNYPCVGLFRASAAQTKPFNCFSAAGIALQLVSYPLGKVCAATKR